MLNPHTERATQLEGFLKLDPDNAALLGELAECHHRGGKPGGALEVFGGPRGARGRDAGAPEREGLGAARDGALGRGGRGAEESGGGGRGGGAFALQSRLRPAWSGCGEGGGAQSVASGGARARRSAHALCAGGGAGGGGRGRQGGARGRA